MLVKLRCVTVILYLCLIPINNSKLTKKFNQSDLQMLQKTSICPALVSQISMVRPLQLSTLLYSCYQLSVVSAYKRKMTTE